MDSKRLWWCIILFLVSSSNHVVRSEEPSISSCVKKLIPCQPFLHSSSPSPICCDPLKEMAGGDAKCLCAVFENPRVMKSLHMNQTDALALLKACAASADISVCKKAGAAPTASPATTTTADNSTGGVNATTGSSSNGISEIGGPSFHLPVVLMVASIVWAI